MSQSRQKTQNKSECIDPERSSVFKIGAGAVLIFLAYSLVTMVLLVIVGGAPQTAGEGFKMLQENRFLGMLRLDVLTIFVLPLYYLIFFSIYIALRPANPALSALSALLLFAGFTLVLATPSAFSFLALSDRYAAAASEADRVQFLAAGEAVLASDMWHGSGALVGGMLAQSGAVIASFIMLGSKSFNKWTAWSGIVTHGLDLAHILAGLFLPGAGAALMTAAGILYLVWFPLLARDLFRLGKSRSQ